MCRVGLPEYPFQAVSLLQQFMQLQINPLYSLEEIHEHEKHPQKERRFDPYIVAAAGN
jgi:hypothetical protein